MFLNKDKHIARYINIRLDFDGVIAQGLNVKLKYAKKWFGVNLNLEQTKKQGFNSLMNSLGKNINYRDLMDPVNEEHIMEYVIPDGCLKILNKLYHEGYRFAIVTSRNEHDYPYAKMFIKRNFKGIIKYVHNTREEPKEFFVDRLRIRVHIDDDLSKLMDLISTPAQLIYYRQPENKHADITPINSRLHEISSWNQFYKVLQDIKEIHEAICWQNGLKNDSFRLRQIDGILRSLSRNDLDRLLKKYRLSKHWK